MGQLWPVGGKPGEKKVSDLSGSHWRGQDWRQTYWLLWAESMVVRREPCVDSSYWNFPLFLPSGHQSWRVSWAKHCTFIQHQIIDMILLWPLLLSSIYHFLLRIMLSNGLWDRSVEETLDPEGACGVFQSMPEWAGGWEMQGKDKNKVEFMPSGGL